LGLKGIIWAAYHAPAVARELGLLRAWIQGERSVIQEIARALPVVANWHLREQQASEQAQAELLAQLF
jgi:hypothetical protein